MNLYQRLWLAGAVLASLLWVQSAAIAQAIPAPVIDSLKSLTSDADKIEVMAISNVPDWQGFAVVQVGKDARFTAIAREEVVDRLDVERFKELWIGLKFRPADILVDGRHLPLPHFQIRFCKREQTQLEVSVDLTVGTLQVSKQTELVQFDPASAPVAELRKTIEKLLPHPAARTRKLFWLERGQAHCANLGGSEEESIAGELHSSYMTLSPCGRYLFYAVGSSGSSIHRSNRNGKNWVKLLDVPRAGDKMQVRGMTVHPREQRVYWVTSPRYSGSQPAFVESCRFDGTGHVRLEVASMNSPTDVAIDAKANQLYWAQELGSDAEKIQRLALGETGQRTAKAESLAWEGRLRPFVPMRIAIDPRDQRLFWVEEMPRCLMRSDLDGANCMPIARGLVRESSPFAIDTAKHHIYWARTGKEGIWRCDYDGLEATKVLNVQASPFCFCIDSYFPLPH